MLYVPSGSEVDIEEKRVRVSREEEDGRWLKYQLFSRPYYEGSRRDKPLTPYHLWPSVDRFAETPLRTVPVFVYRTEQPVYLEGYLFAESAMHPAESLEAPSIARRSMATLLLLFSGALLRLLNANSRSPPRRN